ncbi:MAG: voltage-gated chloride channel [Geobacteraceae bacterium]|nr:voltage-gated chloride channel [Geobacteraceae bacterium]NTW79111.1 voltage-gated chloride channel [Geobacteraceae bacterium]
MKDHLSEQLTIFASIIKWSVYATVVGILSGCGTAIFLKLLSAGSDYSGEHLPYQFFLPAAILASSALVRYLAPDAAGHGTEKVIEAVHQRMGRIDFKVVPVKLVATIVTLAGGGSAGKEGPCAQIGAGLASACGTLLRFSDIDRRKLVICGISAGFSTVFGTPIAGALFGIEVLVLGQVMYEVMFPSFVAGIVGYYVATMLGVTYPHYLQLNISNIDSIMFFKMLIFGIWCGVIALFFVQLLRIVHNLLDRYTWSWIDKALIGGLCLVLIGMYVSKDYLGLGLESIEAGLRGEDLPAASIFWKSIATSITLGCGGSGGVLTPVFFIGTAAGNLFASLFQPHNLALFSAVGMVAMLAAAANTPISASIMAMELFGASIGPYAAVACMTSFLIVGYNSVYPSQLLGIQKSGSLSAPTGSQLGNIDYASVVPREKSLLQSLQTFIRRYRNKKRNRNKDIRQDKK